MNATKPVEQVDYLVDGVLASSGKKITESSFTFAPDANSSKGRGQIVVANAKASNIAFVSQGGKPDLHLSSDKLTNIVYDGSVKSRDTIVIAEGSTLMRGSSFDLGKKADVITFHGDLKKTYVDLGDDKSVDKVILDSFDQIIAKKLHISNFSKKDELIVGGELISYENLSVNDYEVIKVSFKGDSLA